MFLSVTISFDNYRSLHPAFRDDQDDEADYEIEEQTSPWGKLYSNTAVTLHSNYSFNLNVSIFFISALKCCHYSYVLLSTTTYRNYLSIGTDRTLQTM